MTLGATRSVPLVYDFYRFPQKYYGQQYPAPGAPELTERIRQELKRVQPVAPSAPLEAPPRDGFLATGKYQNSGVQSRARANQTFDDKRPA